MKHNGVEITWTASADFLKLAFGSDNPLEVAREELDKLSVASAGGAQEYSQVSQAHDGTGGHKVSPGLCASVCEGIAPFLGDGGADPFR
jgi:hypothetical protein